MSEHGNREHEQVISEVRDVSITGAPETQADGRQGHSHTSAEGRNATSAEASERQAGGRRGRGRRRRWAAIAAGVLAGALVFVGVAAAAAGALMMHRVDSSMSLGDEAAEVKANLAVPKRDEPLYVLVMGLDLREGAAAERMAAAHPESAGKGRGSDGDVKSDAIMLVRVDAPNSKISVLTVPRDYPYTFDDGYIRKLNNAYSRSGAAGVLMAVRDLTGVEVSHYVEVRGSDLRELVDGLGGIDVDVPVTSELTNISGKTVQLEKGRHHLNGDEALALAGSRLLYLDTNSDAKRQSAGRAVVRGILDAILSRPAHEVPGVVAAAASCVKTDLSAAGIAAIAGSMGRDVEVYTGTGPNAGAINPYVDWERLSEGEHPWLCYVNDAGWKRVIEAFKRGDDIGKVSYEDDVVHFAGQPRSTWSKGPVEPKSGS